MNRVVQFISNHWKAITAVAMAFAAVVSCALNIARLRNEIYKSQEFKRKVQLDEIAIKLAQEELRAVNSLIHKPTLEEVKKYAREHPPFPGQLTTIYTIMVGYFIEAKIRSLAVIVDRALSLLIIQFLMLSRRLIRAAATHK